MESKTNKTRDQTLLWSNTTVYSLIGVISIMVLILAFMIYKNRDLSQYKDYYLSMTSGHNDRPPSQLVPQEPSKVQPLPPQEPPKIQPPPQETSPQNTVPTQDI